MEKTFLLPESKRDRLVFLLAQVLFAVDTITKEEIEECIILLFQLSSQPDA